MAELMHGGLWIRWSSLNRRDKRAVAVSFCLLALGGFILGLITGYYEEQEPLQLGPGSLALILAPLLPAVAGAVIYARFVLRQDELFQRFHLVTSLSAGFAMFATLLPLMMVESVFGPVDWALQALLLAFAVGSIGGGFWATRRYL